MAASLNSEGIEIYTGLPGHRRSGAVQPVVCRPGNGSRSASFLAVKADVQAYPPEQLERLKRASKLMFMNEAECSYLLHVLGAANLKDVLDEDQTAILTAGRQGSEIYTKAGSVRVPAVPPDRFIDSTGAGDAFTAGYLAGYYKGFEHHICASLGAVLASYVIEAVGCQTNLPNWTQLAQRYQSFF